MNWDRQPIKPLWLPNGLVPIGNVLFLHIYKSLISGSVGTFQQLLIF